MLAALTVVAVWSAAEASIFFLVADIPVSWIAIRHGTKAGVIASIVAAFASVVGTLAVLMWASHHPAAATATMTALPGIDAALVAEAAERFHHSWPAVLGGAFSGIPFKLFALEAAQHAGVGFLLLAPFLRFPRFLAVALFTSAVSAKLERRMTVRQRLILLAGLWTLFYAVYLAVMPA